MADIKKIEDELWEAADELRANSKLASQQYCMPVLGLIFLRYAWGRFKRADAQIDAERALIEGRKPPKEPQDYTAKGAMFIPEEARYDYLLNLPAQADIGRAVNAAMDAIARLNPSLTGVLPNTYTELGNELLASVIRIFNNPALDEEGDDIIGRIYEYFLGKFAPAVASDDGVFFTPKSLVRMIMNVIEPVRGTMLDPACGSGGMFVSASDYVREQGGNPAQSMMFYGQEKVDYNAKLCLMNMAVHGMQGNIKSGDEANSFYHDVHALEGACDYVAANPPFNVDKVKWSAAVDAGRLPLGAPKENKKHEVSTSGANYLWINYFYSYLNDHGRAGFVMASSATDSNAERAQRRALVEASAVDVMLYVGNNFFYTKSLPCSLWFLDKGKPEHLLDTVLFIDARNYYTVVDRTQNEWSDWQLKNLNAIVWLYRGEEDKYKVLLAEYHAELADDRPFAEIQAAMEQNVQAKREEAKAAVEAAPRKERKATQEKFDKELEALNEKLTVAKEAVWLTEKFGEGVYQDIPGLCKVASRDTILNEKGASLTPGAYVGVAPVEDDGVDFAQRMKEIHKELLELQAESNRLMETISKNLEEMGV